MPANLSTNATLEWDAENRLTKVTLPGAGGTVSYTYDYLGRRITRTLNTGTPTRYVYDGWNVIAEYTGATLERTYTWGMDLSGSMQGAGGVGGLLAVKKGTATYYPTYDGNGNISEYLDANKTVVAHYEYDPFGNTTTITGPQATTFTHRFSTKPLDTTTGLYYYGYRYYDPATGRWPSRDPIGERGGINLYAFAGNDSANGWDYLGLDAIYANPGEIYTVYGGEGVVISWIQKVSGGPFLLNVTANRPPFEFLTTNAAHKPPYDRSESGSKVVRGLGAIRKSKDFRNILSIDPWVKCYDGKLWKNKSGMGFYEKVGYTPQFGTHWEGAQGKETTSKTPSEDQKCVTFEARSRFRVNWFENRAQAAANKMRLFPYAWSQIKMTVCCDGSITMRATGSAIPSHDIYHKGQRVGRLSMDNNDFNTNMENFSNTAPNDDAPGQAQ